MRVSVIVPAHNAADTLGETLASLQGQSSPNWEAIIVDDGSTDNTAVVAARWAKQDSRIRLLQQARGGVSAARNAGIQAARYDWLLLLDADDWLAPEYLEHMTRRLAADRRLDAVLCGSVRVTPCGRHGRPKIFDPRSIYDLFAALARGCPFDIHACVVRRDLVQAVGAFDTDLVRCEDWDLWQRLARAGARFGTVPEVLVFYRMRPGSATVDSPERILAGCVNVIRRGHARDPRVPAPHPDYAEGLPTEGLPEALFVAASWPAGLRLGQGGDARPLLRLLGKERAPALDPIQVARWLFDSVPDATACTPQDWPKLWPAVVRELRAYLMALEAKSEAMGLARRAGHHLEGLILDATDLEQPFTIGTTHGVRIDVDRPIADVTVPEGVERLHCVIQVTSQHTVSVQLPVFGGVVNGGAIGNAIAWPLMRSHLRIGLARDPWLQGRLRLLMGEDQPLRFARQLACLSWPLIRWQFRDGLLRHPQLLARSLWLLVKTRPLRRAF